MESRPRRSSLLAYGDADSGVDLEPVRREIVRPCAMALEAARHRDLKCRERSSAAGRWHRRASPVGTG